MRPSSPSKASAMPAASTDHPATTFTPQQKHARTLRRLKSAHALSSHHGQSHAPSLASLQRQHQQHHQHAPQPPIPPQQSQPQSHIRTSRSPQKDVSTAHAPPVQPLHGHGRTRSNTDATPLGLCTESHPQRHHAATKKMVTSGSSGNKGLSLDVLVREGPRNGDIKGGLECMRYQVLSNGVGSDHDGMVCPSGQWAVACSDADGSVLKSSLRIYVWLILLCAPPIPTDDYLALVHRGPSPAYAKIRNDTFRTLATDPLFRRRVSEASLIRLLNAVAWTLSDRKEEQLRSSRSAVLNSATDNGSPELRHVAPVTNHPPPPPPPPPRSAAMSPDGDAHSVDGGPEAGTYVQGMNVIAAPFLYAARSEAEAFVAFQRFITLECPGYVRGAMDGVHRGLAVRYLSSPLLPCGHVKPSITLT